jgi:hypothetical protein
VSGLTLTATEKQASSVSSIEVGANFDALAGRMQIAF